MKALRMIFAMSVLSISASAQHPNPYMNSWNPFVNQGIVSPAPLEPVVINGSGVLSFHVGNTGGTPLHVVEGDELKLEITLSSGLPDNINPLAALGGSWIGFFNWSYDVALNTYTAIQNQEIPGSDHGVITIAYRVTQNTAIDDASNGFIVSLFPPSYTEEFNSDGDDVVSSYTYVQSPVATPISIWSMYVGLILMAGFIIVRHRSAT